MYLDLDAAPFSRRESHWSIYTEDAGSPTDGLGPSLHRMKLRYIRAGSTDVYDITLGGGDASRAFRYRATPSKLTLYAEGAAGGAAGHGQPPGRPAGDPAGADPERGPRVEIILPRPDLLRLRCIGIGCSLRISQASAGQWEALLPVAGAAQKRWRAVVKSVKHDIVLLHGDVSTDPQWRPKDGGDRRHQFSANLGLELAAESEILLYDYESEPEALGPQRSFETEEAAVAAEFAAWNAAGPEVEDRYREAASQAAYLCWSSIVGPGGNFREPSMLMSKRRMTNTWNWDNYFNAWGLSLRDPELAWRIYQLHFDRQNRQGALADGINEQKIGWIYTKPPVHGLVLSKMMDRGQLTRDRLAHIYPKLLRATQWWFTYRDDDGDRICQYHHGNDSGWDDATVFDLEPPIESPDLSALLIVQLHVLARIARTLGRQLDAGDHEARAESLLSNLLEHSVKDSRFVALKDGSHEPTPTNSLLLRVPIVLGSLLPEKIIDAIAADLSDESRFLGAHGLATESMDSDEFLAEGYWRGPSWAPALMLIVHGLIDAGRVELARTIANRFCDTCVSSGFAECYNAQTGRPLHDRGYTWTASVFLILADWLNGG